MSITDELREFAKRDKSYMAPESVTSLLEEIADLIDEEARKKHEAKCADCMLAQDRVLQYDLIRADRDRIRDDLANNYIELPKDRNGKTIHVGDLVNCFVILIDGAKSETRWSGTVSAYLFLGGGKWLVYVDSKTIANEDGDLISEVYPPGNCEIVEPDTQEKIDEDAASHVCSYCREHRLANCDYAQGFESLENSCLGMFANDLLRRQRELDGVK